MVRNFARSPSYAQWLSSRSDRLTQPAPARYNEVGWELPSRLPPWVTPDATVTVRRMLRDAAAQAPQPIAALPVQHEMMRLTQINGTAVRHSSTIGAPFGVSFQAPYIDDRVLEVALSIRLEDRIKIGSVKPVLAAAMRGLAPDRLLDRTSKSDAIWISYAGLRRHRRELLELCDDSYLARMGLVDSSLLRSAFLNLHLNGRTMAPLDRTFKCEMWLQSLRELRDPARPRPTSTR
jgi:asparagine synthase (glutamine-hydrolysing)